MGTIATVDAAVVVIGGANVDVKARSTHPATAGTSNPGRTTRSAGGVGRNIAENLARLGTRVHLVAAVGDDADGELLLTRTAAAGVDVSLVRRGPDPTGSYTAVLDLTGELVIAVADMAATDGVSAADVEAAAGLIAGAALLVLDGNLAEATVARALDLAQRAGCRVLVEPVSVTKAARLAGVLHPVRPVFAVTPNRDELAALSGHDATTDDGLAAAAARLHGRGVELVWVRLGADGSALFTRAHPPRRFAAHPAIVVDVTGAGDAMLAAFAHALLHGHSPPEAVRYGHAAAALTVAVEATVRPDLTAGLLEACLARHPGSPT